MRFVFLDSWAQESHLGTGTATGISNLARALRRLGHRVDILRRSRGSGSLPSRVAFNLGVPGTLAATEPPDLAVGFDIDGFRWASVRPGGVPYAVSLKGIAADEARFARTGRERLQLSVLAWLERRNVAGADRVLVPSRYSAGVARHRYGVPEERLAIVPEAVDLATLRRMRERPASRPGKPPGSREGPVILSVARQYPRKDTETLLRAMPQVIERHPGARLRVIGGGPELDRLRSLAERILPSHAATFEGDVPDDAAVQRAYLEADLFCLPSRQEGFGIVFVEAMSAGLPVVAARAGAAPEVVRDGETGLLVPPGNETALADVLVRLLDRPEERRAMGAAGARAAAAYDLENVGRRFLEAVRPVIPSAEPGDRGDPRAHSRVKPPKRSSR